MTDLPDYISKKNLMFSWHYRDANGAPITIVTRYDEPGKKKRFHQHRCNAEGNWVEGAPTPLPLFGIDSLPKPYSKAVVYIFEGEKCTQAAHNLGVSALTSMMGSSQGHLADWAMLAGYRHIQKFILIPDHDDPGKKYMQTVSEEIKRACPYAEIMVCELPINKKGNDFVDWLKEFPACDPDWNGFSPLDDPYCNYLKAELENYVIKHSCAADEYFCKASVCPVTFIKDPAPIEEVLSDVLPCPSHTLPPAVTNWMQGIANQMQIPIDFLAVPFIVYTGSLIGRKRALKLRQGTNWIEFSNLWGALIGRPSVMKSPAMEAMIKPLTTLASTALKTFESDCKKHEAEQEAWKIRKKGTEEVYKKSYKDSLDKKNKNKSNASLELSYDDPPLKPKRKRYKTDDPTVEKLGEILIENPQGILLYRDELSGWLRSFEKTGRENDRQFFLESWSGKKDFDVDRIGRGSLHVPALFISIFGSIQPGPLSQYVRSTLKGGVGDDGFLQRFQMIVWPDVKNNWELVEGSLLATDQNTAMRAFEALDKLDFDPTGNPVILNFTEEAQKGFDQWQRQLEPRLRSGSLPSHLEAHFAKYKKLLPALCLIHEHLAAAVTDAHPQAISLQSLKNSIMWIEYLESHAHRIYGSGANAVPKSARELIKHIQAGDIAEPFSGRDVYYGHHWSGLAAVEEVEEVLDYLVEKGYLACSMVKTGGRSTQKYWAHPKVYEG